MIENRKMNKSKHQDWRYVSVGNERETNNNQVTSWKSMKKKTVKEQLDSKEIGFRRTKLEAQNLTYSHAKNRLVPPAFEKLKIIIGDDERKRASHESFPFNSICLLVIEDHSGHKYYGTGFFISKRCIITAGHCVFFQGRWAKEITVIPGANGTQSPFGSVKSSRFRSVSGWTVDGNQNFDHGAVLLNDSNLFTKVGAYMGYKNDTEDKQIQISGYPVDKHKTQWKSEGEAKRRSKFRIYYDLDTVQGNSGSPVFSQGAASTIIGIHTQGQSPNYGVRIRPEIMSRWQEWSQL